MFNSIIAFATLNKYLDALSFATFKWPFVTCGEMANGLKNADL